MINLNQLRLIRRRLRTSTFSVLKFLKIVILWVYYTIPFGLSLFWHVWDISFQFLKIRFWLRITDEGSVPEMRIWSIFLIKSDLKWCIHLRSLFLYSSRQIKWYTDSYMAKRPYQNIDHKYIHTSTSVIIHYQKFSSISHKSVSNSPRHKNVFSYLTR